MASEQGMPVDLHIYDLTHGLASLISPAILGRQIEGVWHTAVVVYNREFFYGAQGISSCAPGGTQLGAPHQTERLGQTFVPFQVFADYLQGLAATTYTGNEYQLLEHNCNHFSEEVAQFLCGGHVPKHILRQPDAALSAPQRQALSAVLDNLLPLQPRQQVYANGVRHSRQDSPDYLTLNSEIEEARVQSAALEQRRSTLAEKLARKERKKEKKRKKLMRDGNGDDGSEMAEAVEASLGAELAARAGPSADDADERRQEEMRRRARDPPIVYNDIDGAAEFEKLTLALEGVELSAEEQQSLDELRQYLVLGEGSWVLGDDFLGFLARLLDDATPAAARTAALRCLAAGALRDDVALLLHQDRRHHALLGFAHGIDRRPPPDQHGIALFMCNLCANVSSSEWLLYISEWEHDGHTLSNIRATTKVCVHAALSADSALRELGTALMHNVATKEVKTVVFDEVCAELAMALLQLLQSSLEEEHLWRCVVSLARLAAHSQDVPQLISMVGPAPQAFRGVSQRVDEQIDLIMKKLK